MSTKSTRGKNFTEREKSMLLSIVEKHKHVLENKATNAANIMKKVQTWEKVASEFNSCSEVLRTTKQLQTAYLNLKRVTRKNVADKNMENYLARTSAQAVLDNEDTSFQPMDEEKGNKQLLKDLLKKLKKDEVADKKGIKATGGGSYKPLLDDVGSQMLAIMGDQIQPLHNNCDSASSYYGHDQEQSANVGDEKEDNILYTFEEPTEDAIVIEQGEHIYVNASDGESTTKTNTNSKRIICESTIKTNTKSNIIKKRRISHTVTSEGVKIQPRSHKNTSAEDLRKEYYRTKLECAVIEKKCKLVELKLNYKRLQLINLQVKNKTSKK